MPAALASVVQSVDCDLLVLSYNNESWLGMDELETMCAGRGAVATLAFDSARYVGARIGIFDPSGRKVGRVGHLSNQELLVIAGERELVRRVVEAAEGTVSVAAGPLPSAPLRPPRPALPPALPPALHPTWSPPVGWIGYNRQREQARPRRPRQRLP